MGVWDFSHQFANLAANHATTKSPTAVAKSRRGDDVLSTLYVYPHWLGPIPTAAEGPEVDLRPDRHLGRILPYREN